MPETPSARPASKGVYRHLCPNCGGPNTEERLRRGLPCPKCIPDVKTGPHPGWPRLLRLLEERGVASENVKTLAYLEREASGILEFFEKAIGSPPWGAQRTWAKRLARGDSFSIIAPTGVGKTTFGAVASLYYACVKGLKSYIVLPTTTLAANVAKRLSSMAESSGCENVKIVSIHSKMRVKERRESLESFEKGDFDILVTTAAFARKYVDLLSQYRFRVVFVDDVDAVLRSARSVDAILRIVGFSEGDISTGMELLKIQREQARLVGLLQSPRDEVREEARRRLAELRPKIEELRSRLEEAKSRAASLIVSSATGRPRGARVRLFRVLLDFEAGGRSDIGLRRVVDTYHRPSSTILDEVVSLVSRLGGGGLVYVPIDMGIEFAETLAEELRRTGVRAEAFHSKKPLSLLDRFADGDVDVLVGVANYYGTLVRGLDMPHRVRYAVFAGVPRHRFGSDIGDPHPSRLLRLLGVLAELGMEDVAGNARRHMGRLRRIARMLSPAALQTLAERVASGRVESAFDRHVKEAFDFLKETLQRRDVLEAMKKLDIGITVENGKTYIIVPDPATYLQASGRTSRLYAGGITLGLSVVVVDSEPVMRGLVKRTAWMADVKWQDLGEIDLEKVLKEIDEDREKVRRVVRGLYRGVELVKTALLVVESPNKARTIARFFGQPSIRMLPGGSRVYEVATGDRILMIMASGGHVFDLVLKSSEADVRVASSSGTTPKHEVFGVLRYEDSENSRGFYTPVYTSLKRCLACGHQYVEESERCPRCGSSMIRNSMDVVRDLRRVAWEADEVYIGTDPDTEGEKIGWDVALAVHPFNPNILRLEFHEVTKKAILEALSSPREFNASLVDAQVVRRVEDRWIGFTLSPLLWCDFWPKYYCPKIERMNLNILQADRERCKTMKAYYNLSAGRVQTPTLGWIVDRTLAFRSRKRVYRILYDSQVLASIAEDDESVPHSVIEALKSHAAHQAKTGKQSTLDVEVEVESEEWIEINPQPPYTTDALLRDANRYLGMSSSEAMRLAQDLFEWGLITYHRTDSIRVSDRGIATAREWLEQRFGNLAPKLFAPRRWGEGGAHEAIRPVRAIDVERLQLLVEEGSLELPGALTRRHARLYELIFRRFIASQMKPAEGLMVRYRLYITKLDYEFHVERLVEIGRPEDKEGVSRGFALIWPYVRPQPTLIHRSGSRIRAYVERKNIPREYPYSEGEVIEEMKRRGIGRPSTYAKIVETLFRRRYIREFRLRAKGAPVVLATSRGIHVYRYLTEFLADPAREAEVDADYGGFLELLSRVPRLVSEERTRELERQMDLVEAGEKTRDEVIDDVFHEIGSLALLLNIDNTKKMRDVIRGNTWAREFIQCALKAPEMIRLAGEVKSR